MKRNVIIIIVVVMVILGIAAFFGWQQMTARAATTAKVTTTPVQRGSIVASVAAAGNLSAIKTASLAFEQSGRLSKVNVQVGDMVKAGQVLMELDTSDLQFSLRTAQAQLDSAQANFDAAKQKNDENPQQLLVTKSALDKAIAALQKAQADYNAVAWRGDILASQQAATLASATADYNSALGTFKITAATINDSALRTAAASLAQAQTSVDQAKRNIDKGRLVAPFDGAVAAVNYNVGDTVGGSGGSTSNTGVSVSASGAGVVIADPTALQVKVTLSEVDVAKIKVGQPAQLTIDALPGNTYNGKVTAIGPVPTVTQGVVNYTVFLSVVDADTSVRPGMTANLNIEVDRRDNVLLIPTRSVRTQGNQRQVSVIYKDQTIQVPVTTGLSNETSIEVTSGLKDGDQVIIPQTGTRQTGGPGGGPGGAFFIGR
jgi:HlyD family secretion protein